MKITLAIVLLFCTFTAMAQTTAPPPGRPAGSGTGMGLPMPGGFTPPEGLLDQFWQDPAIASELRLTDSQKKQLEDASLSQRLGLIDAAADALKSLAHLDALLKADQLDEAGYKQHVDLLAAAAARVVKDLGDMAAAPRRVLTQEQWKKLQTIRRARPRPAPWAAPSSRPGAATTPRP
jgi:Spy/CpxP family protein refolding chaperone